MPMLVVIAIVTGILSGVWASFGLALHLITYAGFLGWSTFFAAGGGNKGLKSALVTNLSGVLWGWLMVQMTLGLSGPLGDVLGIGAATAIGACGMCLQSYWKPLAYIPGAFIGCSAFFATGSDLGGCLIGLVLGVLFGYLSDQIVRWCKPAASET